VKIIKIARCICVVLTAVFWTAAVCNYLSFYNMFNVPNTSIAEAYYFSPSFVPMFYCCFEAMAGAVTFTLSFPLKYWTYSGRPMWELFHRPRYSRRRR
jgi:hypothetical protein